MSISNFSYTTADVLSKDGTRIGYRQLGNGPGIILWHGGMQASQGYMRLATALADTFTLYVPDRRGRGMSGPHGAQYCMAKECEDVEALLEKTDAHFLFGHSSGGLVALQAVLTLPAIHKVAVYEPALSLHGSIPVSWVPRYEREVDQGKLVSAMVTVIKGLQIDRTFNVTPRWLLLLLFTFFLQQDRKAHKPGDISIEALIPTQRFDNLLVKELNGGPGQFFSMDAEVLLLGGKKSPAFLGAALDALSETLPHAKRVTYLALGHDAPNEDGAPERIAKDLQVFFSQR